MIPEYYFIMSVVARGISLHVILQKQLKFEITFLRFPISSRERFRCMLSHSSETIDFAEWDVSQLLMERLNMIWTNPRWHYRFYDIICWYPGSCTPIWCTIVTVFFVLTVLHDHRSFILFCQVIVEYCSATTSPSLPIIIFAFWVAQTECTLGGPGVQEPGFYGTFIFPKLCFTSTSFRI
jgi:hypothetical protein